MTNPLNNNYLVRGARLAAIAFAASCGHRQPSQAPTPPPTAPLPTAGIAGQAVAVYPLTLIVAEDSLHWEAAIGPRAAALAKADSILGTLLVARSPEVSWIASTEVRRAARRAPGIATDPEQMGTSLLRAENIIDLPDPLRSQLRTLTAIAGSGARFALIPAALLYRRAGATAATAAAAPATAELSLVLVDVRTGKVGWRTIARGDADDPWTGLTRAVKALTPGLP